MTIEEALMDLAERDLRSSAYSRILHAILNAYLPGDKPVTFEMTGQDILILVYRLPESQRHELLSKRLAPVRASDPYRSVVLYISGLVGLLVVLLSFVVIQGVDPGMVNEDSELFTILMESAVRLLQYMVSELDSA